MQHLTLVYFIPSFVCVRLIGICFFLCRESSLPSGADPCTEKQTPSSFNHQPGVQSQGTGINWSLNNLDPERSNI